MNLLITISTFINYPLIPDTLGSLEKDFNYHKLNKKEWGYPESVIEKETKKVRFSKQGQKSKMIENGVPFVVTYQTLLNKLSSIIHRKL